MGLLSSSQSSLLMSIFFSSWHFVLVIVRGMMYYRQAFELQAFLDMANEEGAHEFLKNSVLILIE